MTRIDQNQQLIALVRQQLERLSKTRKAVRPKTSAGDGSADSDRLSALQRLDALKQAAPERLHRALIEGLLLEEFGDGVANDARFQNVVDRVLMLLRSDAETQRLLDRVVDRMTE
ncbi:MAG: hypothetical protein AAFX04_10655 [Pseudomonadota bacterium]